MQLTHTTRLRWEQGSRNWKTVSPRAPFITGRLSEGEPLDRAGIERPMGPRVRPGQSWSRLSLMQGELLRTPSDLAVTNGAGQGHGAAFLSCLRGCSRLFVDVEFLAWVTRRWASDVAHVWG